MEKKTILGVLTVIGAFLVQLSLGYVYTVGNMNPYLIDYMGIKSSESVWFNAVMFAGQATGMPIGGLMMQKMSFRWVTLLGMILSSGGVLLSRLTVDYGLGPFIFTYCVMFGIGIGLPYSILLSVAAVWFPKYSATVIGIISSGFGLGALVFTPFQTAVINPENIPDFKDPRVRDNVPNAFLYLGALMVALQVVGLALCRQYRPPSDVDEFQKSEDSFEKPESSEESFGQDEISIEKPTPPVVINFTILEALQSIDFYLLWFILFLNMIPAVLLSSTYKTYGKENIKDDIFLSAIATTSSAFNCLGRITWGIICDKFSFKCPLNLQTLLWAILFLTFPFIVDSGAFRACYPIWVFALFFTMAGHLVLLPGAATRIFGPKYMATIYGLIFFATAPSALGLSAIISQFDINGKWVEVYISGMGCCLISFLLSLFLKDKKGTCGMPTQLCANACNICRNVPAEAIAMETGEDNEQLSDEDKMSAV